MNNAWVATKWAWVLFAVSLVWIVFGLAVTLHCQTICVRDPLIPYLSKLDRQPLRQEIEGWVRQSGRQVGCTQQSLELLVEPLNGVAGSGATYFVLQHADGVGTLTLRPDAYWFGSWQVSLFPMGRVRSLGVRTGPNLRGTIRSLLRKVRG